jgi:hypothetical protein
MGNDNCDVIIDPQPNILDMATLRTSEKLCFGLKNTNPFMYFGEYIQSSVEVAQTLEFNCK